MTTDDALEYMSSLVTFNALKDRERFTTLLESLGAPQKALRCVHVAGTNGKGSTATFIASILRSAGYRVGTYLSPFVFDLGERWQVDGAPMTMDSLTRQINEIRPHIDALAKTDLGWTTEFELKTAIAFRWFVEQAVDIAVIEVGIGGTHDSTNVIGPPLVAAITSIGFDHVHLLGNTLGAIATQKAGILKVGTVACVTPVVDLEARRAIERSAAEVGVPVVTPEPLPTSLRLGLLGGFQRTNAATAASVCRVLRESCGFAITDHALHRGLENAFLPGRFQVIPRDGKTLVLDVAHNAEGAGALVDALSENFPGQQATFIIGVTVNHDPVPLIARIAPLAREIIATEPHFRPLDHDTVGLAAEAAGIPHHDCLPVENAIQEGFDRAPAGGLVVVTGSFYTVCETPHHLLTG